MKAVELKHVDETYINRYFRNRSIFKTYKKSLMKTAIAMLVLIGIWLAGALAGLIWSGVHLFSIKSGETNFTSTGIIIFFVFFLLLTAGCVAFLLFVTREARKPEEHWRDLTAKNSGYSVGDIREFEKQAMESASLLVPIGSVLPGAFKNGFLTRDYICFVDLRNMLKVMKCQDIVSTCIYWSTAPILGTNKQSSDSYFDIFGKNGRFITTPFCGNAKALQEVLKERYPQIEINAEKVLSEKEHGKWLDQLKERNKTTS